jgi:integrase
MPKQPKRPELPRGLRVIHDKRHWIVWKGKTWTGGKIKRSYFKTEREAWAEAEKILKDQKKDIATSRETGFTTSQLAEIRVALDKLGGRSILDAISFYDDRSVSTTISLEDACSTLEKIKEDEGLSDRHLKDLGEQLEFFKGTLGEIKLSDILRSHVEKIIKAKDGRENSPSASRQAKRLRYFRILINEGLGQSWIKVDPTLGVKTKKQTKEEIVVLTPRQVASLLMAAKTKFPDLIAPLAIKIFSGVRHPELFGLDWKDVGESIIVKAAFAKTGRKRSITIPDVLDTWLAEVPKEKKEGRVYSHRPDRKNRNVAWLIDQTAIAKEAGITLTQNCMRHAFGSYHYAQNKDEDYTAYQMGNSPSIVKQNYVTAITTAQYEEFWSLTPSFCESLLKKPDAPSEAGPPTPTKVRRPMILPEEWGESK